MATYNIGASVELLPLVVVLALVVGPVLELKGGVGAGSDGAGDVLEEVALVAGLNLGDVGYNLRLEGVDGDGVCGRLELWSSANTTMSGFSYSRRRQGKRLRSMRHRQSIARRFP